jgi:hypothetical protein
VIVDFETVVSPRVDLVVKNVGELPAYDVRLNFTPPLSPADEERAKDLPESPLFRDGVEFMQAGREYRFYYGLSTEMAGEPPEYEVEVIYDARLPTYSPYRETTTFGVAAFIDTLRPEASKV